MLDWKEAAPLIGVILTAFCGLIGLYLASRVRTREGAAAIGAVPSAIAGALAERGVAEGLSNAVIALQVEIRDQSKRGRDERSEAAEDERKFRRDLLDHLDRLIRATERRSAS